VFFGPEYKVLRGGSFAVSTVACRGTFPQLGLPDQEADLLRLPHRQVRYAGETPDVPPPCLSGAGPPRSARCSSTPPHGLYRQAWAPRRQRYGTVNADGFGVGWYAPGDPDPGQVPACGPDLGR